MQAKTLSAVVGCWLLCLAAVTAAQAPTDNQLLSLFAHLRQTPAVSPETEKSIQAAIGSIPSMSLSQLNEAIPTIVAALAAEDERVQGLAALACFAVVQRPDGTSLLARDLPKVAALFESSSARVGGLAGLVLLNAKTTPGPDVMSRLVAAINQRNRSADDRVPAIATAVGLAPTDPAVVDAVTAFVLQPLEPATKAAVLAAIRPSRIDTGALRLELIAWLQDADPRVKVGAISVLTRMGPDALTMAKGELERITQRDSESSEVRGAAGKALRMVP